jgi:hypothetical protein
LVHGTPSVSESPVDECDVCLQQVCPDALLDCYAVDPHSVCGYGEPGFRWDGEFPAAYGCLYDAHVDHYGEFTGSQAEIDACLTANASGFCGKAEASSVTRTLVECMAGLSGGTRDCMDECGLFRAR